MNGNEGVDKGSSGSGSTGLDVGKPDPTQMMPPFPQGPAVDSMSIEDAQKEWEAMTLDSEGKYKSFPRSVFLERRNKLWERGFAEKIANEEKTRQEESREWLEKENDQIEERDALEALNEGNRKCEFYFGSEKNAEAAIKVAKEVFNEIGSDTDKDFMRNSGLGNNPRIIEILGNLKGHPELYPAIKNIGLKNLIQIGNIALKRRKR